jgi:hypothetical protein
LIVLIDQHVRRFKIAMENAGLMRVMNGFGNPLHITRCAVRQQRAVPDDLSQVLPPHVIHREKVLPFMHADFMHRHDVRMLQDRRSRCLDPEAMNEFLAGKLTRTNHLHRHRAVQGHLPGLVDHAHPALRDFLDELVVTKTPFDFGIRRSEFGIRLAQHHSPQAIGA